MKQEVAALILHKLSGKKSFPWKEIFETFSTPQEVLEASKKDLRKILSQGLLSSWNSWRSFQEESEKEAEKCEEKEIFILDYSQKEYPSLLREISHPPVLLYARGNLEFLSQESVALVGSRRASIYGLSQARRFASSLAESGMVVVSGLARGIDSMVHKAALEAGGKTIAVLGSGLLHIYPRENHSLSERIAAEGLILSEFPPHAPPLKHNFPWRNRIISGLCRGVMVVEGGDKSGTLLTARWALEQNREVFALPGPVDLPTTSGTHALIQSGAKLVTSPSELLQEILPMMGSSFPGEDKTKDKNSNANEKQIRLNPLEEKIFHLLRGGQQHFEILHHQMDISLSEFWNALFKLEIQGLIQRLPGNYYCAL